MFLAKLVSTLFRKQPNLLTNIYFKKLSIPAENFAKMQEQNNVSPAPPSLRFIQENPSVTTTSITDNPSITAPT